MMRKYVSLKLQHKTYVDDTTKTYERDLQIKNCAFYFILACVQTSPPPSEKGGRGDDSSSFVFPEEGGRLYAGNFILDNRNNRSVFVYVTHSSSHIIKLFRT